MAHKDATLQEVDQALKEAQLAFLSYKNFSGKKKATFLRAIADEIEALGAELVSMAMKGNKSSGGSHCWRARSNHTSLSHVC
jgi:acyl-CoA reductase-like NAD-dependent aldehyde dehydrogenase